MQTLVYDGSFAGWLTAVFYVYEYKYATVTIQPDSQRQDNLFGATHVVHTDKERSARVWKGLCEKVSKDALKKVYKTFLSEQKSMEDILLRYVQYAITSAKNIEGDYSHAAVLYVNDMAKKVHREKHRMEAFVRFKRTQDNIYYATIDPDFNVLPLIWDHFEKRYADQQWLIYDTRRKYGLFYDLQQTNIIEMDFNTIVSKDERTIALMNDDEELYQSLWKHYFESANIKARKNIKLHIRHMPKRYWKYLVEKQQF